MKALSTALLLHFGKTRKKPEMATMETSRAKVVAINAEVRRVKARLMEEVPKLQKLAQKKELDRQVPLIDEIDTKVDTATSELKNTNVKLKHTLGPVKTCVPTSFFYAFFFSELLPTCTSELLNLIVNVLCFPCVMLVRSHRMEAMSCWCPSQEVYRLSSQNVLISLMIFQSGTCSRFAGFRPSLTHFSYQLQ
nr:uncharacterized protein LOC113727878 [Coffea arabica]